MNSINLLLLGAIAMSELTAALFFLRFWSRTRDRLFALFSIAFLIDAIDRIILATYWQSDTDNAIYFLLRVVSYGTIVIAVVDKNWKKTPKP